MREFNRNNSQNFVPACLARLSVEHEEELRDIPVEQREAVTSAIFDAIHEWAATCLPMGASPAVSERFIRKGLHAAKLKVQHSPPAGIDPMTVLTIVSVLFSIVGWIVEWWRGRE